MFATPVLPSIATPIPLLAAAPPSPSTEDPINKSLEEYIEKQKKNNTWSFYHPPDGQIKGNFPSAITFAGARERLCIFSENTEIHHFGMNTDFINVSLMECIQANLHNLMIWI